MVHYYHSKLQDVIESKSLLDLQSSDIKDRLGGQCTIQVLSYARPCSLTNEYTIHWKVTQDGVTRFVVLTVGHIEYQRLLKLMRKGKAH